MSLVVQICLSPPLCCLLFLCVHNLSASLFFLLLVLFADECVHVGFSARLQAVIMYWYQSVHKLGICLREGVFTWVNVKLALHCLGNALQFDSLQGAVSVDSGGQAAQRLPDEVGHLPYREDLQQFAINCRERPQKHSLGRMGGCSIILMFFILKVWIHFVEN